MYKATLSFTATNYDIRKNQIIDEDFIAEAGITEAEITEYLNIGYLVEYDGTLEITENGVYDVEDYQNADVDVPSGEPTLQEKSVTITSNKTEVVTPETGYDALSKVTVTTNIPQPTGTISITENGTVDVTNYASANVSVESSSFKVPEGMKFAYTQVIPSNLDTSEVTDMSSMFYQGTFSSIPNNLNTSSATNISYMFRNCIGFTELPLLNTSKVSNMHYTFYGAGSMATIGVLDTSNVTDMGGTFTNCYALSNESLNNILRMCINTTKVPIKTLVYIGISSAQATTCQSLSNWSDFVSAGWTTGY